MNRLLSVSALVGAGYLLLLFGVCFFFVHLFRLAKIGWQASLRPPEKNEIKKEEAKPPEPVYYIVEKKKKPRKPKTQYSEPREFRFR